MTRMLYVSAFMPTENSRHAGGRVAHENLVRLRQEGHEVDALVCTTESAADAPSVEGIATVRQRTTSLLAYLVRHGRSMSAADLLAAPILHTRLNDAAHRLLCERLAATDYDGVFVDFTQALLLVQRALQAVHHRTPPVTACLHDVFAQRMLRSRGPGETLAAGVVMKQEQRLVDGLARVVTLSPKDKALLEALYGCRDVWIKPFAAPDWCRRVDRQPRSIDRAGLLFFGNFDRVENSEAARWFAAHALDAVRAEFPDASLLLVGTGSDRLAAELRHEHVRGTGFVEDPSSHFSRCALAVAPLFRGAGVKFKVLETLACGVPVVGTPVACEGVEEQPQLHCASPEHFVEAVVRQLRRGKATS